MKHTPKVGSFVLETLTTGMYGNPLDCIREYVQNASDAILTAERFKMLKPNTGVIELHLDPKERSLTIRDNGTGQSPEDAVERLLNIGMSSKVYGQEAGFRGIGRLAGIAYCDRLTFTTTTAYSDECVSIVFDCASIRKSLTPDVTEAKELSDLLQQNTSEDIEETAKAAHFFEVRLESIDRKHDMFLDFTQLEDYLGQVAPVEFDSQRFIFAPKIQKWVQESGVTVPTVKMIVKTSDGLERQIFKPYHGYYRSKRDNYEIELKDVCFFAPSVSGGDLPTFWMWYGKADLLGMFGDDRVAGIRFRRNNIAIGGPERMAELFPGHEGRLNAWTIGEVHIMSDGVIPNARRDGFEATDAWARVKEQLAPFIRAHCKACHDASSSKSRPTQKVVSSARAAVEVTKKALRSGLSSTDERDRLASKLDREIGRIEKAHESRDDQADKQKLRSVLTSLQAVRERLETEDVYASQKLKSSLDRKQRKVLTDVMAIIDSVLTEAACTRSHACLQAVKEAISAKYGVNTKS
ncbi:MAG: ATP-binding protein [Thermoguttaceae bacterium]|jgi:molecular chaperone HtpG|nr:ATP-binding protein [Thermoguttaceae bacterium]